MCIYGLTPAVHLKLTQHFYGLYSYIYIYRNPACNAGGRGSTPGRGTKIPHAMEQLSLHITTRESTFCNERP